MADLIVSKISETHKNGTLIKYARITGGDINGKIEVKESEKHSWKPKERRDAHVEKIRLRLRKHLQNGFLPWAIVQWNVKPSTRETYVSCFIRDSLSHLTSKKEPTFSSGYRAVQRAYKEYLEYRQLEPHVLEAEADEEGVDEEEGPLPEDMGEPEHAGDEEDGMDEVAGQQVDGAVMQEERADDEEVQEPAAPPAFTREDLAMKSNKELKRLCLQLNVLPAHPLEKGDFITALEPFTQVGQTAAHTAFPDTEESAGQSSLEAPQAPPHGTARSSSSTGSAGSVDRGIKRKHAEPTDLELRFEKFREEEQARVFQELMGQGPMERPPIHGEEGRGLRARLPTFHPSGLPPMHKEDRHFKRLREEVLQMLQDLPESEWKGQGQRSVGNNGGDQLLLHLGLQGRTCEVTKASRGKVDLILAVNALLRSKHPRFAFSTCFISRDYQTALHQDKGKGFSALICLGDFWGGRLWIRSPDDTGFVDVRNKFYLFDSGHVHATEVFKGRRYALTFYLDRSTRTDLPRDTTGQTRKQLDDYEFNLEGRANASSYRSVEEVEEELLQLPLADRPDIRLSKKSDEAEARFLREVR